MMKSILLAVSLLALGTNALAQVTWTEINHSYFLDNRVATSLLFDDRGMMYAGSWNGLHVSSDRGVTWSPVDFFKQIEVDKIIQTLNGHFFVAGWRQSGTPKGVEGIWRSKDHGATWEGVTAPEWATVRAYSIVEMTDGALVAGTADGFLRSTDDGDSWCLSNGRFHPSAPYSIQYINALYRTPNNTIFAQIGGPVFGRSTNGGTVWSYALDSINSQAVMSIDSDGRVFVPGDSGVYRSTDDGVTWQFFRLDQDLQIYSLSIAASNGWIFGLGARPILSTDHGETWNYARSGLTWEYNAGAATESPDHYIYFTQLTGALWRTKNPITADAVATNEEMQLEVYPNPSTTDLFVVAPEPLARMELIDVSGRTVRHKVCSRNNSESLSLNEVEAGPYVLRVLTASGTSITRRIVVR
jgi:photosystem II stability/assembly factor-like uncharacterized protein